jgi:hypothetical protein
MSRPSGTIRGYAHLKRRVCADYGFNYISNKYVSLNSAYHAQGRGLFRQCEGP